jgi:hypothetical protein
MRTSRTTFPALLTLAVLAAPAAASAQGYPPPPPPPYSYEPVRSPWYIGFGLGSGNGSYVFNGARVNYLDHHFGSSPFNGAFQFEMGATLTPNLLFGGELSGLTSWASSGGIDTTLTVGQLLAVGTWFPTGRGLFLRGGAGFASISSDVDDGFTRVRSEAYGVGVLGGAGYAWWLGRTFNLTLHGDVNLHAYNGGSDVPSSSATFTGYLGFRWY